MRAFKIFINIVCAITLSVFALSANAAWTSSIKVNEILATGPEEATGFIVVVSDVVGVDSSEGTCAGTYHYLNAATEKGKMVFSMFLTAKTLDKTVKLELTQGGSSTRCVISGARY